MIRDFLVSFAGKEFVCVDKGFGRDETVDVVIRPEDIKIVPQVLGDITGVVESVIFKGVHYEMRVNGLGYEWTIHSTQSEEVGAIIGMTITATDIHIMKKSEVE